MITADEIFAPVYGKPSWNVEAVYSSFLSLEFGEMCLWLRDPRVAIRTSLGRMRKKPPTYYFHGTWHLWFYQCDWRVMSGVKVVGDSSSQRQTQSAASKLEGKKLRRVTAHSNGSSEFEFDKDLRLETTPRDTDREQWFLYEVPSFHVATFTGGHLDTSQNEICFEEGDARIIAAIEMDNVGHADVSSNQKQWWEIWK